jgi:hypothetical protein
MHCLEVINKRNDEAVKKYLAEELKSKRMKLVLPLQLYKDLLIERAGDPHHVTH